MGVWGGVEEYGQNRKLGAWEGFWQAAGNLITGLGHTYDRSIVVDGEEASLMVYDIWEQVRCRLKPRLGMSGVIWG